MNKTVSKDTRAVLLAQLASLKARSQEEMSDLDYESLRHQVRTIQALLQKLKQKER